MRKLLVALTCLLLFYSIHAAGDQTWVTNSAQNNTVVVCDTLKAAGSTDTLKVKPYAQLLNKIEKLSVQYTIADVNTNVVVALEGSHNGTNWTNLDEDGNTTQTANGTYGFEADTLYIYYRFRFISETGGTDATIYVTWLFN